MITMKNKEIASIAHLKALSITQLEALRNRDAESIIDQECYGADAFAYEAMRLAHTIEELREREKGFAPESHEE